MATPNTTPPAATGTPADLIAATHLAGAFRSMSAGLVNLFSENTTTQRTFQRFVMPLDPAIPLTAASLATALKVGGGRHVDLIPAGNRLDASEYGDPAQEIGYRLLTQMMGATLGELFIAYVRGGRNVRVPTYIFGRLDGRFLVGLKAITVET
jgi:hypothetical protein